MAKTSPDKDLDYIRDRIQTQFVTTDLDSSAAEEEIANLAERTILVKRRVTDSSGFLKDRKEPPYIELGDFLGAGGQYLVFRGKIHFSKIRDFSRLWIPLTAHQAMEEDGADLTQFMDYTKKLTEIAQGVKSVIEFGSGESTQIFADAGAQAAARGGGAAALQEGRVALARPMDQPVVGVPTPASTTRRSTCRS